ncbi:Aldo/keto reductase family protein [Alteracholeplasma palmae J233]|uniref:Aldo/keto reductase family protein n=1 Tax=Alteracholeplasma palmae (strain ATCC 49389 / J233) TaxID=1318466 RepID=U4KK77_ALTPJ|nr:aldo/keto reductase [Alteracholeplasma palmae]CCV64084.1 Aldo/keto reductase family protein [Alteracholeplasma palmae J233]
MKYNKLSNGLKMPVLGLGTFLIEDGSSVYDTVLNALKIGYRHIDTAYMYRNEKGIGDAIRDSKIPREEIFITTKLSTQAMGNKELLEQSFQESLDKLQTNYVDLLIIHWPSHNEKINAITWEFLEEQYKNKKALAIGVSNFQRHHLEDLFKTAKIKPMINQVELHPGLSQVYLQKYLEKENIAITSYGPLMKGMVFEAPYIETLTEIAAKYNASVAQIIIAWGLKRNIFMIPKSVNEKRLLENFNAKDIKLENKDVERINQLNKGKRVYTDPDNNPIAPY